MNHCSCCHVIPVVAFREPHSAFCETCDLVGRLADRSGEDVVTEHELLFPLVCLIVFGIVVIHRAAHGNAGVVGLACGIIYIR